MFVLSVEGPDFISKVNWSTHKVLGVYHNAKDAENAIPANADFDETMWIVTDTLSGVAKRIEKSVG